MNTSTVLIVDDDAEIRDVIHVYLRNDGFRVLEAENGLRAVEIVAKEPVQLIILDVMMPDLDGIKACIRIRETSDIPIIMLSAKQEDIDKITGLSTGADDYVSKPFSPLELMARVKAQLRRQNLNANSEPETVIRVNELMIDVAQHQVTVRGQEVALTPLEFAILELLASHRGQVFHADQIYEKVWKEPSGYSDNTVMVHIRNIRDKIEDNSREPRYIKTVWGVGYKIEK
ncbi:response regulator transcription factor [Cohnella cholangitidis]|uniref:Response regulator transcription factor n=1 Tax=Cohnella cholangitidis TaxID=2598458 RepID=A0A7G5BV80_9BACL|nr:response regulator transcription factor [Cohnella cholangitidis]QMV40864.1 response regulator transcription factor [Cohnella cholangitidis]